MDKKIKVVRKHVIKVALVSAVLVVCLGAGVFMAHMYLEDIQNKKMNKEGSIGSVRAQLAELSKEMESGEQQTKLHNIFIKNRSSSMTLNREQAMKWIVEQREKHHLVNMSVTIPPFTDVPKETFPLKTGGMIKSDVKLTFSTITDNSVYAFIALLQKEMPGAVFIRDVKITRTGELSRDVLLELSNHRITPVVGAEIMFDWIGIRETSRDKSNEK